LRKRLGRVGSTLTPQTTTETPPKVVSNLADSRIIYEKGKVLQTIRSNITDTCCWTDQGFQEGFPALAAFRNSDDSFSNYRKFGYAHALILSQLEVDITELEKELFELDKSYATPTMRYWLKCPNPEKEGNARLRDIKNRLRIKLGEYGDSQRMNTKTKEETF
jgi:hypothetical protein